MRKLLITVTLAAGAAAAADWYLRTYRPVDIPLALAGEVGRMRSAGWTVPRWHPLTCRETGPHAHLTAPGGLRLTIGATGKVAIR